MTEERNSHDRFLQPETRPISLEQLAAELVGIYAGLEMIEAKCIEVDRQLPSLIETRAGSSQWPALIALHRTLLHEHHDFLLASQHPSASPELRELVARYDILGRMWRHGVHSFIKVLQRHLPSSLDFMLEFIYLSYSMMALLYETVPVFAHTWVKYLGDISRYRSALKDKDSQDGKVWACNARFWHSEIAPQNKTI
jgi:hypothetical protein